MTSPIAQQYFEPILAFRIGHLGDGMFKLLYVIDQIGPEFYEKKIGSRFSKFKSCAFLVAMNDLSNIGALVYCLLYFTIEVNPECTYNDSE